MLLAPRGLPWEPDWGAAVDISSLWRGGVSFPVGRFLIIYWGFHISAPYLNPKFPGPTPSSLASEYTQ
jgi:hypothetical protein